MPSTSAACSGPSPSKAKSVTPDPITSTPKSSKKAGSRRRPLQKPLVFYPSSASAPASRDQCVSAPVRALMSRTNSVSSPSAASTPKARRQHYRSMCSGSPSFFAASRMTESPQATDIPLPPANWMGSRSSDAEEVSSICSDLGALSLSSASSTESPTPDHCSVASDDSGFSTSSFSAPGTRIDPLHLIAAVAAS
ncbi:hypothetical protein QR680_007462 [Steinernema hermaphroditum]|uniref:Uncharacterized protein n=1 Tax=Steinernema hermaphroditum TaxID=289476 RepID=A0AA39IFE6_9BILA|nr:hypothetical protein QR680_007462 [Steinernema hermaphroditum]